MANILKEIEEFNTYQSLNLDVPDTVSNKSEVNKVNGIPAQDSSLKRQQSAHTKT